MHAGTGSVLVCGGVVLLLCVCGAASGNACSCVVVVLCDSVCECHGVGVLVRAGICV